MVFPQTPRDTCVELFLNSNWVDVTSDVYARDDVVIKRGSADESATSRAEPSSCQLTLNNRAGNYSPRNPNSIYFGSIGRNTPLRVTTNKDRDTFTRSVSGGWGSTETLGLPWATISEGGTIAAGDFDVTGGVGRHIMTAAGNVRATWLSTSSYGDVDITFTVSLTSAAIAGGYASLGGVIFRALDADNYTLLFPYIDVATQRYFLGVYDQDAGVFTSLNNDVDTGVTFSSGQAVRIRSQMNGGVLLGKLWVASNPEPYDWQQFGVSPFTTPGGIGIRTDISTGNTNTKPMTFTYDNLVVRIPRFAGEISYWPQRWDTSGNDIYAPIEAAGIMRRLGQGTAPVQPAMRTEVLNLSGAATPIVYWPCEEGADATQISPLIGTNPMFTTGSTKFAEFSGFACSLPLPTLNVGRWQGRVPAYTATGFVSIRFLLHVGSSEPADDFPIIQLFTTGSAPQYEVKYHTGGKLGTEVWSPGGVLYDGGVDNFISSTTTLIDNLFMVNLFLKQNGSNVDIDSTALKVGDTFVAGGWSTTLTGRTLGSAISVVVDPYSKMNGVSVGHITVRSDSTNNIFDTSFGLNAYGGAFEIGGETAVNRMNRLTRAAGLPIMWQGNANLSPWMGPQKPLPLLTLLGEAADVDMGILHENRGSLSMLYRSRHSMYNQAAALTLNYSSGHSSPPLEPVDDDQQTRNDVIPKRTDGGQFELFLSSGALSVVDPWLGGVGTYTDSPTLNVRGDDQLRDIAGWRLLLGTQDRARYPNISIELANPNIVSAGLENAALSADVGDRIVITNMPAGVLPKTVTQIVRGYTETIGVFSHRIDYVCAPEEPYEVLRADTTGKMTVDSGGASLASSATTTATSLSVATAAGNDLWITGAVSFDIGIDGEQIHVSNISGAASPQTFTVTRSVNGIIKSHSSGAAITLFRPAVVAL